MKNIDIIEHLTNDITRNAYRAEIQDYIAHNLGYDRSMMEFEASVGYGKAFEAIKLLNLLTDTEKGDDLYNSAKEDAHGMIDNARVYAATAADPQKAYIIALLNAAGYIGAEHYAANERLGLC